MIKNLILALSSVGLITSMALANPEADNLNDKPAAEQVLLVKTDINGNKKFYKVAKKVSPVDVPAVIEAFAAGKTTNVVEVNSTKVSTKNPKNPEAEGDVEEQSWYYYHGGYRYGYNRGYNYYHGHWPRNYYYNYSVNNYWAPRYQWCYGYSGNTWAIYW